MSEKKKILFVVHQMNIGGVQKSLLSVLAALDYDRCEVTLYVRKNRRELLEQIDPRVQKIVVNEDPTRYYRKPRAVFCYLMLRLCRLIGTDPRRWQDKLDRFVTGGRMRYEKKRYFSDGTRYDTAVSYIQGYPAEFVAKYVNAARKIVFYHGSTDELHALHEQVFPKFDTVVAVNAGCRDILKKLYPAVSEKITYVENYVDAAQVRRAAQAFSIDRAGSGAVLCTCGRFTAVKGFDLALAAAAILKQDGVDFLWYFVGDGPERAELECRIAENGLADSIRITGMLENPYPYIAGCDIYVQPSREEAQPLSVIEAQILCRPAVSTKTVGGTCLIENGRTGLLAEIDAADIAEKLALLLADAALSERITAALREIDRDAENGSYRAALSALLLPEGKES